MYCGMGFVTVLECWSSSRDFLETAILGIESGCFIQWCQRFTQSEDLGQYTYVESFYGFADSADVSSQTIRVYLPSLIFFTLVRLAISFLIVPMADHFTVFE